MIDSPSAPKRTEAPRITDADFQSWNPGPRRLLAEAVGALGLTAVAGIGDVAGFLTGGEVTPVARAVAPGLFVMAMIYAIGDVSGLHINPAVTVGFTAKRLFPVRWLPTYVIAQLIGATVAGIGLVVLFGHDAATHAVTQPQGISQLVALALEVFLTWALITVILGTADRAHLIGPNAAIAVGATIILCGLIALPLEGASMNPARSTGPAIATGEFADLWIYWLGPLIGAAIAVAFATVIHPRRGSDTETVEAASGKGGRQS